MRSTIGGLPHDGAEEQFCLAAETSGAGSRRSRRVGSGVPQLAQEQPLPGEIADQRIGSRVGEQSPHLPFEHRRILQLSAHRRVAQFLVRNAAPDEERQPRRELEIADAKHRARSHLCRLTFESEEEIRIDQYARHRALYAASNDPVWRAVR
jgi:hypothetical protein